MAQKSFSIFAILSVLLSGCVRPSIITQLSPRPKVNIESRQLALGLDISSNVPDAFTIPKVIYASNAHVSEWHKSLQIGFHNAFSNYFRVSDSAAILTIKLLRTEISFAGTGEDVIGAVSTSSSSVGATTAVRIGCNLLYQAQLIDSSGQVVAKDYRTAHYDPAVRTWNRAQLINGAVEKMYEQIALKFFPVE